jgi:exonuclease SbcC
MLEQKLQSQRDLSAEIPEKKNVLSVLTQQEKNYAVQQATLQAQLGYQEQQRRKLQQSLQELSDLKLKLAQRQQTYRWLEEYFLNLTYTIEKHLMVHIHHLFNQLFQEWFSILIDDETISSRIDDSFTPIIEQNGYEISFLNLSGGEKTSAALAYRLALNRVINDVIHDIKTKEILILDEPTDGFSSEQLDKVRDVLERLHLRQTIIVSHESKIESFVENVIRVRKEGHLSTIR